MQRGQKRGAKSKEVAEITPKNPVTDDERIFDVQRVEEQGSH